MKITNVVFSAHLDCTVDLNALCQGLWNCRYDPKTFPRLIWQHRVIVWYLPMVSLVVTEKHPALPRVV